MCVNALSEQWHLLVCFKCMEHSSDIPQTFKVLPVTSKRSQMETYYSAVGLFHICYAVLHQLSVYLLKAGPLLGVSHPAAQHEVIVDPIRTAGRLWQVNLGA